MKQLLNDKIISKSNSIGLLCNQTAWHTNTGEYSFQYLADKQLVKKVFVPEHGLFGELQDQEKLDTATVYNYISETIEWISLYGKNEASLTASAQQLAGIDVLIIDLQDVGSRYYTFITTIWLLLKTITIHHLDIKIIVLDKPNPAGRKVEGTRMPATYSSFIGLEGLPHRHGLTLGELCLYFKNKLEADWELVIYPIQKKEYVFIAPSPNIPSQSACELYSGQCLWEGTNISEGRGTTLPFALFGAPFLNWVFNVNWNDRKHPVYNKSAYIRPLKFIPVFHKYANSTCSGLHLIVHDKQKYHSLAHSLQLLKYFKANAPEFEWKDGKYEAFNDKKAIELLVGDKLLLDYVEDKATWKEVKAKLQEEEAAWIKEASPFLIYKSSLKQLKIK